MAFTKEVVNKVIDPSFELASGLIIDHHTGTSANGATGPTWTRVTGDGTNRNACCEAVASLTSSPGTLGIRQYLGDAGYCHGKPNVAAGADIKVVSAPGAIGTNTKRLYVQFYKQDKASFASVASKTVSTKVATGNGWERLEGVVSVPADAYWFVVGAEVTSSGGGTGGYTLRFDSYLGAIHDTIVPYFDGASQGADWDVDAEISTSWRWDYDLAVPIGDEIYDMFAPYIDTFGDPSNNLRDMSRGFGTMLQPIDDIARDGDNGEPGFSQVLDLTRAKESWLPWLGQFVGYRVTERRPEQDREQWADTERARVVTRSAHRRGTIARMVEEVQSYLIDPKQVFIQQRVGTPHRLSLFYFTSQIQAPATASIIAAAAQAQKAKGLILTVTPLSGGDWNTLVTSQATWNVVTSKFASWSEVVSNPTKP